MVAFTILGLPAHPLVVHGAVVGIPLAALAVIAYVVLPARRAALWWPVLVTVLAAWSFSILAGSTGETLEHALRESKFIHEHAEWAERLELAVHVLGVSTLIALIVDRRRRTTNVAGALLVARRIAAPVALVAAIGSLVLVAVVGHLGAQAAWHDSAGSSKQMQAKTAP